MLRIVPSDPARLAEFREFWNAAIAYQAAQGVARSPLFPAAIIVAEITDPPPAITAPPHAIADPPAAMASGRHFMGLRDDGACAGFFSVTLSDKAIWRERDRDDAIYIHRMCVNPRVRGARFSAEVLRWARGYAVAHAREFVRMDTWADNERLIAYYQACGYHLVGWQPIGHDPSLSSHYHGITLALFENAAA